jgi:hypothetical protein
MNDIYKIIKVQSLFRRRYIKKQIKIIKDNNKDQIINGLVNKYNKLKNKYIQLQTEHKKVLEDLIKETKNTNSAISSYITTNSNSNSTLLKAGSNIVYTSKSFYSDEKKSIEHSLYDMNTIMLCLNKIFEKHFTDNTIIGIFNVNRELNYLLYNIIIKKFNSENINTELLYIFNKSNTINQLMRQLITKSEKSKIEEYKKLMVNTKKTIKVLKKKIKDLNTVN